MNMDLRFQATNGDEVTAGINPGGVHLTVVPRTPSLDDGAHDYFSLGIRFTSVARALAKLQSGTEYQTPDGGAIIRILDGKCVFRFQYDHAPGKSYETTLTERSSKEFLAMLQDALNGAVSAIPRDESYQLSSTLKVGRNDPCSCGSGKKFKKCCMKHQTMEISDDELPEELLLLATSKNQSLRAVVEYCRENPKVVDDGSFWSEIGTAASTFDEFEIATACLRRALTLKPNLASALSSMAVTLNATGRGEEGLELMKRIPDRSNRKEIISANILQNLGRHQEAIEQYELAIEDEPDFFLPYARILNSLRETGSSLYEHWLQKGCHANPTSPWLGRLYCLYLKEQHRIHELADADWIDRLESEAGRFDMVGQNSDDPKYIIECQLYRKIATILRDQDAAVLDDAVEILQSIPADWNFCDVGKALAAVGAKMGRPDAVIASFKAICADCIRDEIGLETGIDGYLAFAFAAAGDHQAAIQECELALQQDPDNISVLSQYWWSLDETGRIADSVSVAEKLFTLSPDDPNLAYNLGYLCGKQGAFGKSKYYYEQELKRSPENRPAVENMCFTLFLAGNLEQADDYWKIYETLFLGDIENAFMTIRALPPDPDGHSIDIAGIGTLQIRSMDEPDDPEIIGFLKTKQQKFEMLRTMAADTINSPSFAFDLVQANNNSMPIIGANTSIANEILSIEQILDAFSQSDTATKADVQFKLESLRRGDQSAVFAIIEERLPQWRSLLPPNGQASMIEAERRVRDSRSTDHSQEIVAFAKAVEITLHRVVFDAFKGRANVNFNVSLHVEPFVTDRNSKANRLATFIYRGFSLELGSMAFILNLCRGRTADQIAIIGILRDFIQGHLGLEQLLEEENLARLQTLARDYRNPAAHEKSFDHESAMSARQLTYSILATLISPTSVTALDRS